MRYAIASQFICHYLSRFAMMLFQQSLEETLSSRAIAMHLEKHIDNLTILVDCPPQVLLFAIYSHKHLGNVKSITESLMPFFQSFGILRVERVTP